MHSALNKQINVFEFRHLLADGQIRDVEVHSTPIKIQLQTLLLSIIHDTTESKQAKEVLAHQRKTYEQILDHSLAGYWDWDIPTGNEYLSPTFKKMFGYEDHEIENRAESWQKLIFAEDLPGVYEKFNQHVESKGEIPYYNEVRYHHKNGSTIWVICTGKVIEWEDDGKAKRMIGCHIDITDRKQAEEALKLNYALLQIAGETAIFGGWSVDLEKNICTWSDAVADIHDVPHGYSPPVQEAINFYAPKWREKITQCFSACAKEGNSYDEEMEIITQKGKRVWVRTTGKAVKNEKDKIIKVQGSFQDITKRKQAEEEIARRELTLNKIFDVLPIGLWFADKNGKLLRGNPAGVKIWGAEPTVPMEEYGVFKARRLSSGEEIAPDDWALAHTIQKGVTVTGELLEIDAFDGQKKIILNYTAPVVNDSNEMLGAIVVNNDITHHKQAEAEREKIQVQLHQAQKMESVGRLAGGVAHDFNNMLGVILGHTELALLRADENHELHDDLKEIQKAAKRSADITKQLLAFARKQTISPRQLDLNDTVESMLNMLRRLIGEDIDLVWRPSAHLWPVKMDPSQIDQILVNLCVNARDAIAGVGKLTIETGRKSFDEEYCNEHPGFIPGDFVLLAVSDNGCGMDKDTLDNLFEPFFTTKDVGKGTGLGLATLYGIVKQNNGFINVYSEPGQGTTFRIYLPRHIAEKDSFRTVPEKKAAAGGSETILLVEDEPTILRMTRMMLECKGYTVISAATPAEAIEKAKNHAGDINLLMTDVVMPEMNGRDLAGKITDLYPHIGLLFMSGYTSNVIAHHGVLDAGVAFIQKPFSMGDMTQKVRDVLDTASDKNQG